MFLTFEGIEGSGKSTIAQRISAELRGADNPVIELRDPGDTALGQTLREILLHAEQPIDPYGELLLFFAARRQLIVERISPALRSGTLVACDRFFDSTTAYQGYGRGLSLEAVATLRQLVCGNCEPQLTVLLDVDAQTGLERATRGTTADRMERESVAFLERVRDGFLQIARAEPERVIVVEVVAGVEETLARVRSALMPRLAQAGIALPKRWTEEALS